MNIPIQTLIILPELLLRKIIISQLELRPPVRQLTFQLTFAPTRHIELFTNVVEISQSSPGRFCKSFAYFHFANYRFFNSFRFVSQITVPQNNNGNL